MELSLQLAAHLRQVYSGGNWTSVNLTQILEGITYKQATESIKGFNTIAALVYHINYYVTAVTGVLKGQPLTAKDSYGFNHPLINNEEDWQQLKKHLFTNAETFATLIEKLPQEELWKDFTDKKYGSLYRNLQGIIEHTHYHLGQITLLKKLLL